MSETKYNPLVPPPEGSDWNGEQHRRTEFKSLEAKAAYDAPGLIELARQIYGKQTVTVAEALDLRRRGDGMSGDDDTEAPLLRRAIAIELTKKPEWKAYVDGLEMSDVSREKLRAMLSPEAYALSVSAYRETDGTQEPPTLDAIRAEVMKWSLDRLRKELEMREKPIPLIVSDTSFDKGIKAMDANKHYRNSEGDQEDAHVYKGDESPYVSAPRPAKVRVSITEGVVHPKQLDGVSTKLGARRDHLTAQYEAAGMRHIDGVEMEALIQRSLIEASETSDNTLIVDNWETGHGTATFLNPESLTKSDRVAYSCFDSDYRRAYFGADYPGYGIDNLRGRASVQVMEF